MEILVQRVDNKGFAGKSAQIRRNMIEPAAERIREKGIERQFKLDLGKREARVDITSEKRTVAGGKEDVVKIQVQLDSDTYSSVIVRQSALQHLQTDGAILEQIADSVVGSYEEQKVHVISYE